MKEIFLKYIDKTLPQNIEDNKTNTISITMENIQVKSPTLQIIESYKKQEFLMHKHSLLLLQKVILIFALKTTQLIGWIQVFYMKIENLV